VKKWLEENIQFKYLEEAIEKMKEVAKERGYKKSISSQC